MMNNKTMLACHRSKKRQSKSLLLVRLSKKRLGKMGNVKCD